MTTDELKKEVADLDKQIVDASKEIELLKSHFKLRIYWLKKRRKLVLQQMETSEESSVETLKEVTSNLK